MAKLAQLAEDGVDRAHARMMSVDDDAVFDTAVVTFDRVARCLRLSMALEARLFREHRSDRRDERLYTVRARDDLGQGMSRPRASGSGYIWNEREGDGPEGSMDRMVRSLGIDPGLSLDDQALQIRQHIEQKLAAAEAGRPEAPELMEPEPESEPEPEAPEPEPPEPAPRTPEDILNAPTYPDNPISSLDILLARLDAPHPNRSDSQRNPPPRPIPDHPFPYRDYS